MQFGKEVYKKNLKPSFKSIGMNVGIFAYIARESQMSLISVRKMSKKEYTNVCDRLSVNAFQFVRKIYQPYIIFFIHGLCANLNHIYLTVDGAT